MRRQLLWALGIIVSGLIVALASHLLPPFSAAYTLFLRTRIYPVMRALFSRTAVPVGELFLIIFICIFLCRMGFNLIARRAKAFFSCVALALSFLFFIYAVLWPPMYASAHTDVPDYDTAALHEMALEIIDRINALCDCVAPLPPNEAVTTANQLMGGGAKLARYPEWMQRLSIAGIYLPWTFEAVINPLEPAWTLPFTACHELAHARGAAGELEANLLAYFSCLSAGSSFEYSAQLCILRYAMGELHLRDASLWSHAASLLSPKAAQDFSGINGFSPSIETDGFSHWFLRMNGYSLGASGYTHVIGALIAMKSKAFRS